MSDTGYGDFEFERRFFVREFPRELLAEPTPTAIVQSYLLADDGYAVRVRLQADGGALDAALEELPREPSAITFAAITVKGPMTGGTRYEAERELDPAVAAELVLRGGLRVLKRRYAMWLDADGWVVDVFEGANAPLVIAEVERGGPVVDLTVPDFCTTEVTDDRRFANDALASRPFSQWSSVFEGELAASGPRFLEGFGVNRFPGGPRPSH